MLGLSSPTSANGTNAAGSAKHSAVLDLGAGDAFTSFLSASPTPAGSTNSTALAKDETTIGGAVSGTADSSLAKEEQDFFNQVPTEKEKTKMTKDSIMALYATAPNPNTILGQFNGTIGAGLGSAFSQFTSPIAGYTIPHAQINASPNIAAYGPPSSAVTQSFGCTIPSAVPNAFVGGAQMIGAYQQQQSPLQQQQQQQHHPQQQFATFPPIGVVGGVGAPAAMQAAPFQMPPQFTHSTGTAPTNGTLNQQFANLNVWQ